MDAIRRRRTDSHPLFGRSDLLAEVDRLLEQTRAGAGRGLLITGPGGIGKTETLRAVAARARTGRVARGRALPDELPVPFALVRDLIGSLASEEDPLPESDLPAVLALPILLPTPPQPTHPPEDVPVSETPEGPPDAELERILAPLGRTSVEGLGAIRYRMYGRLTEYFLRLAEKEPLLITIDDLHFADPSSLHFLELLAPELPTCRIAVVATVGEGLDVPARSREVLERLGRNPSFRSMTLRPLSLHEITEFAMWVLGGVSLSSEEALRWQAQTNGNPLLVEQVARSTAGTVRLAVSPAEGGATGIAEVLIERSRSLPDLDRRVLTYAAVLGREFDFPKLSAVIGLGEERVTEAIDRLVLAGLLRERGGEVYEFVSEVVRGGVYAELTETRRRILHRKVATALEAQGGTSDFELSRQFYLGRDDAKAVEYNIRAAEAATRAFAFDAAVSHLARALEAERRRPDRERRREIRLLTEEGRLLGETGDYPRSEEILTEAVALAREDPPVPSDLGRATLALAWVRSERSDYTSAETLASEAFRLLEPAATSRDRLAVHRVLGTVYWRLGDLVQAETHQRAALEIAEREGTPLELGHALVDVANVFSRDPQRVDSSLTLYQRAADLFATGDDLNAQARVLMNRAVLENAVGRVEDGFRDLAVALEIAERSRSPIWISYCLINLAQWETERKAAAPARAAIERAEQLIQPLGDGLGLQQVAMVRGMIAELEGTLDEAEARYQEALGAARALHMRAEMAEVLFRLAHLAWRRGDAKEALARIGEARTADLLEHRPELAPRVRDLESAIAAG